MTADRWIRFDAITNFRDIGGYPAAGGHTVRWRTVYRSGTVDAMSDADARALHSRVGVRTVIDLRRSEEVPADLPDRLSRLGIAHHNVPLGPGGGPGPAGHAAFLVDRCDPARPAIATAIGLLLREDALPAVLACRLGRDRTGLVALFLLTLLGVPAGQVAGEFALSAHALPGHPDEPTGLTGLGSEVLGGLRTRYGDLASALHPYGVDRAVIQSLRDRLTVRDGTK